ncbi:MAG: hypothetical protein WC314_14110 [Vulcanimicrobiota bacterium]
MSMISSNHTVTHSYRVARNYPEELSIQAESLDRYYDAHRNLPEAKEMWRAMEAVSHLKTEDNSAGDLDHRRGHVVRPADNFEFHKDTRVFSGEHTREKMKYRVKGDDAEIRASSNGGGQARFDPQTRQLEFRSGERSATNQPEQPTSWTASEQVSLPVSSRGKVFVPPVESLQDVSRLETQRENGIRAQKLVSSALYWFEQASDLDGSAHDLNPAKNEIVAAGVNPADIGSFSFWDLINIFGIGESHHRDSLTCGRPAGKFWDPEPAQEGHYPLKDLEMGPDRFTVLGSHGQGRPDPLAPRLSASQDGRVLNVTFSHPRENSQETVVWNQDSDTLSYQKTRTR